MGFWQTEWNPGWVLAIKSDGSLVAWDEYGDQINNYNPAGNYYTDVSAGVFHSLAIKTDSTLVAWGGHANWNLCNVPSGSFSAISAGIYHSLARRTSGALVAWGANVYNDFSIPIWNNYLSMDIGGYYWYYPAGDEPYINEFYYSYSLGLKAGGTLVAWGFDFGNVNNVPSGNYYTAISAGKEHALALKTDGSIVAWGNNYNGQCDVPPGNDYTAIAAGAYFSLALKSDGTIVGWGDNSEGQLNFPTENHYFAISAGNFVSAALADAPISNEDDTQSPEAVSCLSAYPNPFSNSESVNFSAKLKVNETGTLSIYNIKGQKVKSFEIDSTHPNLSWDGRDKDKKLCSPGMYLYQFKTNLHRETKKLIIIN
jgi:hypothetical protein